MKINDIVFMGTPDFAAGCLQTLLDSEWNVKAVFTQPDKPRGRSGKPAPSPVKELAVKAGIPVYQPVKVREPEVLETLKRLAPDVIVVAAFGQLIPGTILDLPHFGCINVHASLLPCYRGAAPIQWAILDGRKETGVTIMRMDRGLDTGDVICRKTVPIDEKETGGSLFDKLCRAGSGLLLECLHSLEDGTAVYEPQPEESPTAYARMLTKEMGRIDWNRPAKELECQIRGLNPWPTAYTRLNGKQLKIWAADVAEEPGSGRPGEIVRLTGKTALVQTGQDCLALQEVQLEGKKRMPTDAFLRGYPLKEGMILGEE